MAHGLETPWFGSQLMAIELAPVGLRKIVGIARYPDALLIVGP